MSPGTQACETDVAVIGGGPAGLFAVFELGLLGLSAHVIDVLPALGGQCTALYGDKPIYDIPGTPVCTGHELTERLLTQISPFKPDMHLGQLVTSLAFSPQPCRHGFQLDTDQGRQVRARAVVIAAGAGAFLPRKPPWPGLDALEQQQKVQYHLAFDSTISATNPERWASQDIVILGDDDVALTTALRLCGHLPPSSPASALRAGRVTLIHRRDRWRAAPEIVHSLHQAHQAGRLVLVFGQATGIHLTPTGDQVSLCVTETNGAQQTLTADLILPLLGLSPKLAPLDEWGIALKHKLVSVDPATFETSVPGIYAIGDVVTYPGKRKLILNGFHEATLAAHAIAERLEHGGKPLPLLYTTSSSLLQQRLGVLSDEPPHTMD